MKKKPTPKTSADHRIAAQPAGSDQSGATPVAFYVLAAALALALIYFALMPFLP